MDNVPIGIDTIEFVSNVKEKSLVAIGIEHEYDKGFGGHVLARPKIRACLNFGNY